MAEKIDWEKVKASGKGKQIEMPEAAGKLSDEDMAGVAGDNMEFVISGNIELKERDGDGIVIRDCDIAKDNDIDNKYKQKNSIANNPLFITNG